MERQRLQISGWLREAAGAWQEVPGIVVVAISVESTTNHHLLSSFAQYAGRMAPPPAGRLRIIRGREVIPALSAQVQHQKGDPAPLQGPVATDAPQLLALYQDEMSEDPRRIL